MHKLEQLSCVSKILGDRLLRTRRGQWSAGQNDAGRGEEGRVTLAFRLEYYYQATLREQPGRPLSRLSF